MRPGVTELVMRDLASGRERVLASGVHLTHDTLSFSPDGRRVAFEATGPKAGLDVRAHVVDLDSGAIREVPAPEGCRYRTPQFLPRSDLLAVVEECWPPGPDGRRAPDYRLVLVEPARGEVRRTVHDPPTDHTLIHYRFDTSGEHTLFTLVTPIGSGRYQVNAHRLSLTDGSSHVLYPNQLPEVSGLVGAVTW
jgi:hypothetical protein